MKSKEKTLFLHALSDHGIVSKAAEAAKISRSAVYRERGNDHEFKEAWDHAKEIATDRLANIAHQRAIDGIEEIRYFKGEPIGTVRRYSDQLLMFLLRAYRPSVFGGNQQKNFESKDNNHDQARQSLVTKMATLDGNDLIWSSSSLSMQRDQTGSGNARALTRLQMRADLEFSFLHEDGQPEKDGLMLEVRLDFSGTTLSVAARRAILYDVTMEASTQT